MAGFWSVHGSCWRVSYSSRVQSLADEGGGADRSSLEGT